MDPLNFSNDRVQMHLLEFNKDTQGVHGEGIVFTTRMVEELDIHLQAEIKYTQTKTLYLTQALLTHMHHRPKCRMKARRMQT